MTTSYAKNEFGPNTAAVENFLNSLETLPEDHLARIQDQMPGWSQEWQQAWEQLCATAREVGLEGQFDAAIDAAWHHAEKREDYAEWEEVWETSACHVAAAITIRDVADKDAYNTVVDGMRLTGRVPA